MGGIMQVLLQDLRFGARMLIKNPGFTLVAMFTLALGIGANTAIFSVTNALLLRPFDFHELDRLVKVSGTMPDRGNGYYWMAPADFADLRREQMVFSDITAFRWSNSNLTGSGEPERIQSVVVLTGFFRLLGSDAAIGRTFLPEEEQAGRGQVVILGYRLWQRRFGADPKIIGTTISLDGKAHTVIVVMPESFDFPKSVELWTPLALSNEAWNERKDRSLEVLARLKAGVEIGQANTEVGMLAKRLAGQYPHTNVGRSASVRLLRQTINGDYNEAFLVLLTAAVGFVLAVACLNIANMQLSRASSRMREMAVRAALGAGRFALIRQLLTESLILGLLGGVFGLLVSFWFLDFVRGSIPLDQVRYISGWENIRVNERVMIYNLLISLASGVIFGLVPALQGSRPNLNEALKEGG